MQVFVQDAAEDAAALLGVPLSSRPLEWDDGTMEIRAGPHKVVLDAAGRRIELSIAHGRADDVAWCSQVREELSRGLAALAR